MTRTLELLDRLIAFPTISSASNLDLIDWAQMLLRDAGLQVNRIPSPDGTKAGLFAQIGPAGEGGICLSAHTDVVPVEGQDWTRPAFKLTQDSKRLYGRGTTDMKGFLASALAVAERAGAAQLNKPLSLCLSYDEEVGCVGIRDMLPALSPLIGKPRAVIVGEPTSMQIATGHKGKIALRVTCRGEAGHSALAPNFVNAIHVAMQFVSETRLLQGTLETSARDDGYDIPYSTVHVGRINGGRALNIVPDLVTLEMEIRHLPQVNATDILGQLQAAAERISALFEYPDAIEIIQTNAYPGLSLPAADPVIDWARRIGPHDQTNKVAFGTEAGFFAGLGLPTFVTGPGDMAADGHKPDEGLAHEALAACDTMMDRVLADLSG